MVAMKPKRKVVILQRNWFKLCVGLYLTGEARFESLEQERETWLALRDVLLPDFIKHYPGRRPAAWWKFDKGREMPFDSKEQFRVLMEMGELSELEIAEVERRKDFVSSPVEEEEPGDIGRADM
jgi:hypothetical protein